MEGGTCATPSYSCLGAHGEVQVTGGTWFASMKWWSWPLPDLKMTILDMMKTGKNGRRMVHIMFMNQGAFKMMNRAKLPVYLLGRKRINKKQGECSVRGAVQRHSLSGQNLEQDAVKALAEGAHSETREVDDEDKLLFFRPRERFFYAVNNGVEITRHVCSISPNALGGEVDNGASTVVARV